MKRRFNAGDFLFRQGDHSDGVLRIENGSVEILRDVGDGTIVLGTVLAGQFVGEMGVIENRARNASARAVTEVEAEHFSVPEFFQRVSSDPNTAAELDLLPCMPSFISRVRWCFTPLWGGLQTRLA